MFDPTIFGFEKWNKKNNKRYNLFLNNDHKIYHLTQKENEMWIIELIKKDKNEVLYQGFIPSNGFAFELFNNFEYKIPNIENFSLWEKIYSQEIK